VNAGALLVRRSVQFDPVVAGGGQERGYRGGTVDVAAAVGLAAAVRLCASERVALVAATRVRQRTLESALRAVPGLLVTAPSARRLPGHVHVTVEGVASDEMLFLLDQANVCASAASSCSSGAGVASHVLAAMGVPAGRARGAVRFTMGPETTDDDVTALIAIFSSVVAKLRANP
jgi:cysteine desulfurase